VTTFAVKYIANKQKIIKKLTSFTTQNKLEKDKYHSFKDISLPSLDEKAQIEHIVVSRFGIFLIEKKYMKGWIYGFIHSSLSLVTAYSKVPCLIMSLERTI